MKADLHIHTFFSDGSRKPKDIVKEAVKGKLDLIAITDHDTFSGYKAAAEIPAEELKILCGIEFSTFLDNKEVHILGYFDSGVPLVVEKFAAESQRGRVDRVKEALTNFDKIGIKLDFREVEQFVTGDVITRNHIANALVKEKIVPSVGVAFGKYLSYEKGIVPPLPLESKRVIDIIHEGGGKAVWAHPELGVFDTQIENLVSKGLDGVEVYGGKAEGVYTYYLERVSEDFNLLKTGGSDFHGYARNFSLGDFYVTEKRVGDFLDCMKLR